MPKYEMPADWGKAKKVRVHRDQVTELDQLSGDSLREVIRLRMDLNLQNTGHPLHHMVADGQTIIDRDPSLEQMLERLEKFSKPTVPCDPRYWRRYASYYREHPEGSEDNE